MNKRFLYIGWFLLFLGFTPIIGLGLGAIGLILFYIMFFFFRTACNVVCGLLMSPLKFFGNLPIKSVLIGMIVCVLAGLIFLYLYRQKKNKVILSNQQVPQP